MALNASARAQSPTSELRVLRATSGGFDGSMPGPLLRVRQGDELKIRLQNEGADGTAIHWHGIRIPNAMDGAPNLTQPLVAPGSSFDYAFKPPDAGTFWYRAPSTLAGQVARGLYGLLIVAEKTPVEVDRDVMLVVDDRSLPLETIAVKSNERLRVRLLNASNAAMISLRFDRHAIRVTAIDGQPAEPFLARDSHVSLAPGNRIDVFLDAALEPGASAPVVLVQSGAEREFARIVYDAGDKKRPSPLPDPRPLPANPLPERIDLRNAMRVAAPLDMADSQKRVWTAASDPLGAPFFSVKRGRAVVLAFPNETDIAFSIHLHGHHARLLDNLDDGWKPFWLDTVTAGPRRTTRIAFVADNPGKWLIDCRRLGPPDAVSVTWFEVT